MEEQAGAGVLDADSKPTLLMSARRRWAVTAGVLTGMFLAALEATVVGTAMPTVIASDPDGDLLRELEARMKKR